MERYICIHGHFYQPPRENPWIDAVELQDSAYPYHDWNERITAECYAPNSVARILDADNRIAKLVNNYAKISFNFGPTLLQWLEAKAPDVYKAILEADRQSRTNFSGHGSALAQAYNHIILPLANRRDRITQVLWGIRDFKRRFKRLPEGMWLPETAVDLETLNILAESGIRFTILAPHQAQRVRPIGADNWEDVSSGQIDSTRAYVQFLPSGRKINLFFYNGAISRSVAFEGLLAQGEDFVNRLTGGFSSERDWPQLVHIATDGESYGHHHRFGDMALAYALHHIETNQLARLTNYGEYLERHPPTHEVNIIEKTSWSCFHGIDRWWSHCGCNTGSHPGWNQQWRTPLRDALDDLRDSLAAPFDSKGRELLKNPWAARDDYLSVIQNRSNKNVHRFFARHALQPLSESDQTTALKLLELQRHAMLMYTSCGWFFDELSGLETVQVMQFASRAAQLGQELFGDSLEAKLVDQLASAKSNLADHGDGRTIYEKHVRATRMDWESIGAHYAVSSLFQNYPEQAKIYTFAADRQDYHVFEAGSNKLLMGRVQLTSEVTRETAILSFGALHLGDHNVNGGVREFLSMETDRSLMQAIKGAFLRADFTEVIRLMDRHFGESNYSLRSLFRDEQRKAIDSILAANLNEAEALYRQIYERRSAMMRFLTNINVPLPKAFLAAAEFVINSRLRRALQERDIDMEVVEMLIETAKIEGVGLDIPTLEFAYRQNLERLAGQFVADASISHLKQLEAASGLLTSLPFGVNLWKVQNIFYRMLTDVYPRMDEKKQHGHRAAGTWIECFETLGKRLAIKLP
jgi:alpha-amylase/alpha-mannosidase (GH57 family)